MNHRFRLVPFVALAATLAGCATVPASPQAPLFVDAASSFVSPTPDLAQIVFLAPADRPVLDAANALFELDGDRRVLLAVLAAHCGSFQSVKPGHHVFMAWGRVGHLLEANVEGGARYYVLMRADGPDGLQPLPVRMTDDAEISNRSPESARWIADTQMVDKTAAADAWFARKDARVATAQAAALAAWQRKSPDDRAALTLQKEDAVLR